MSYLLLIRKRRELSFQLDQQAYNNEIIELGGQKGVRSGNNSPNNMKTHM